MVWPPLVSLVLHIYKNNSSSSLFQVHLAGSTKVFKYHRFSIGFRSEDWVNFQCSRKVWATFALCGQPLSWISWKFKTKSIQKAYWFLLQYDTTPLSTISIHFMAPTLSFVLYTGNEIIYVVLVSNTLDWFKSLFFIYSQLVWKRSFLAPMPSW